MKAFKTKNNDGQIRTHVGNPNDIEYTLCGLAFDCSMDSDQLVFIHSKGSFPENLYHEVSRISCEKCKTIINFCKEIK